MSLILVELNEINFDIVRYYLKKGFTLPGFDHLIKNYYSIETSSELEYENLEPWIQWPSVHTGKTFKVHNVFRLGDFINSSDEQFFEIIEGKGYKVGAVSPMNASNNLKDPSYFIPDPWTQTPSDGSFFSRSLSSFLSQVVNDNSKSKITISSFISLFFAFFVCVRPKKYFIFLKKIFKSFHKPWYKALFFDLLLFEIHLYLFNKHNPDFSTVFLNAGAHIQHHYLFNSPFSNSVVKNPNWYIDDKEDPILDMLFAYDSLILDFFEINNTELILATGLSQKPFDHLKFYYRLSDHSSFLNIFNIKFRKVIPRMTRDFLVEFDSSDSAMIAHDILSSLCDSDNVKLFGHIDNRGDSLFIVLTYPHEITSDTFFTYDDKRYYLSNYVDFVAIKNGEHQGKGFAFFSTGLKSYLPSNFSHVSSLFNSVVGYFNNKL